MERQTTATHEVFNQPDPLSDFNLASSDIVLMECLKRHGADWALERITDFGERMGSSEVAEWAEQANRNLPVLKTYDRFGHRIDEVDFHPAWHKLMSLSTEYGLHNLPWVETRTGSHVARAALMYMAYQVEAGHCCPISMTYSALPVLRGQHDIREVWEEKVLTNAYDGRLKRLDQKSGVILGMGMTEKQGGSDVRANTTRAVPNGDSYRLTGHKWFCSAPMSDAFLILAQAPSGLSCFLVPRILEDGSRNNFFIQRLKDKLGNKSNASSEVEFQETVGFLVGQEGRGVPTIIEMVNHTRLDCAIGSAGLMRQAILQAVHHCRQRSAFGKTLIEQPLMQNVLCDLAVESEAATLLTMRLAEAYDLGSSASSAEEQAFRRIVSAVAKFWLCKRTGQHVAEALECLGGAGYVEESIMPRLYRESPLNSIWEGSGNVICLDVLRAVAREGKPVVDALALELDKARGADSAYDRSADDVLDKLVTMLKGKTEDILMERSARRLVQSMAIVLQASLVLRFSPDEVKDCFISSRLKQDHGYSFGTLDPALKFREVIDRASML